MKTLGTNNSSNFVKNEESTSEDLTLAEIAYRGLRRDIIAGYFEPNQPLRLEVLKNRYDISFSPLREALNRLQTERLVTLIPARGFRVASLSEHEMWDAINTRILIDCKALKLSIEYSDTDWKKQLELAFQTMSSDSIKKNLTNSATAEDEELLESQHRHFHMSLIAGCKSLWLMDLSEQLYTQTERYRRPTLRAHIPEMQRDVDQEHKSLLDAAISGESELASALLAKHYRDTGLMISKALNNPTITNNLACKSSILSSPMRKS